MRESFAFQERAERLERAILTAVDQFRCGDDHLGLDHFLYSIDDLEMLIERQNDREELQGHLEKIINVLEKLYELMKKKDIIAMTDLLEYKLFPLIKNWHEGRGNQ